MSAHTTTNTHSSKYTFVDLSEYSSATHIELMKFFDVNRVNVQYSKRGYRERLRQAFEEQSGLTISPSVFRQKLYYFRKEYNCPVVISNPLYKSVKER